MRNQRQRFVVLGAIFGIVVSVVIPLIPLRAQTGESKTKDGASKAKSAKSNTAANANVKALAVRAQRSRETYVRELVGLARDYEAAGHLLEAKQTLQAVHSVDDSLPGVSDKIKFLDEEILTSNEVDLEIDVAQGWGPARANVAKARPFRVQSDGTYKFVTNLTVGVDGFPNADPTKDMADGIRCGALMGLIVMQGKPGKPFPIGTGQQHTPKEDGVLFLAVNLPPGHNCSGRLKVRLSGYVEPL